MLNGERSSGCQALGRLIELRLIPSGSCPRVFDAAERNVSTTLRQWHLDFRLDFPPLSLVG